MIDSKHLRGDGWNTVFLSSQIPFGVPATVLVQNQKGLSWFPKYTVSSENCKF